MKKKVLALGLSAALAVSVLAGCTSGGTTTTAQAIVEEDTTTEELVIEGTAMKDRAGNDIIVPSEVDAIVSMAPSTTELLISMGLADKIVACDTYSGNSIWAEDLPADIPQFDMMAPDNEAIVALDPDVVFTTGMSYAGGDDVYAAVRSAGVCVADLPTAVSVDDIEKDIAFIGEVTGADKEAQKIVDSMDATIADIKACAETVEEPLTVLYVMSVPTADYPDVYTCGQGTYMDEIFTMVGLKNVAGDIEYEWPAMSEEDIVAADPDIIICGDTYTPDAVEALKAIEGWKGIKAVKNNAVYAIDGDAFNQPNQFVLDSALQIGHFAYPDAFKDLDEAFTVKDAA